MSDTMKCPYCAEDKKITTYGSAMDSYRAFNVAHCHNCGRDSFAYYGDKDYPKLMGLEACGMDFANLLFSYHYKYGKDSPAFDDHCKDTIKTILAKYDIPTTAGEIKQFTCQHQARHKTHIGTYCGIETRYCGGLCCINCKTAINMSCKTVCPKVDKYYRPGEAD